MFVGKTLSEKLKFAADILQAINIFLALVAGLIIWYEFDLFAGILSTAFFIFVTWTIKLSMYALSQVTAQTEVSAEQLQQIKKYLSQCPCETDPVENQSN